MRPGPCTVTLNSQPPHKTALYASHAPQAPTGPAHRSSSRPWIIPGQAIDAYSDTQLLQLAQWIRSDDILRTEDELLQEMMRELGFQRRGKNVVATPRPLNTPHMPMATATDTPAMIDLAGARGYTLLSAQLEPAAFLRKKADRYARAAKAAGRSAPLRSITAA